MTKAAAASEDAGTFLFGRSHTMLRNIVDRAAIGMAVTGMDGVVVYTNNAFKHFECVAGAAYNVPAIRLAKRRTLIMRFLMRTMLMVAMGTVAGAGPGAAQPYDPVTMGQELVRTYCADCHAIGTTGQSPFPPAPPLRELQLRYNVELLSEALVEGLTAHPDMPEFEFDPEQAAAIIAYLKSLAP